MAPWLEAIWSRLRSGEAVGRSPLERNIQRDLANAEVGILLLGAFGLSAVAALAFAHDAPAKPWALIGIATVVALASSCIGGFLGFLFGIPRTLSETTSPSTGGGGDTRHLRSNTNLEQISDWLTKIFVGATLVQIKEISGAIFSFAQSAEKDAIRLAGPAMNGTASLFLGLMTAFGILGFIIVYLQTRTLLSILFARTEAIINSPALGQSELQRLTDAAKQISLLGSAASIPNDVLNIARRVASGDAPDVDDPVAMKQRGLADVVLGRVADGASTLKKVVIRTGDAELASIASRLLARSDRPGAAKDLLPVPNSTSGQLSEVDVDALLNRMFASLYEPAPYGFQDALKVRTQLQTQSAVQGSPQRLGRLSTYSAAALGQCYRYTQEQGETDQLPEIRRQVIDAIKYALANDSVVSAKILQSMLNGDGGDDDLVIFKSDPEIPDLIRGAASGSPKS